VELILLATTENPRKQHATQVLDQLRTAADRWNVGLRLFVEATDDTARFFGLSLVRNWLQSESDSLHSPGADGSRGAIRGAMLHWVTSVLDEQQQPQNVPVFLLNNAVSVLTLCVKRDFPVHWPTAFAELLQLGYKFGIPGIDLVTRVLVELEVEVVMFSEGRSKAEAAQNTLVKDTMRDTEVVQEVVVFLCRSAQHCISADRADLCASCLRSLAELMAWVDTVLVVQQALPTVYQLWQQYSSNTSTGSSEDTRVCLVRAACSRCLWELVKKGMDPVAKVLLLNTVGLVPLLTSDSRVDALLSEGTAGGAGSATDDDETSEEAETELVQLGQLLDVLVVELFGCWCKYEDFLQLRMSNQGQDASVELVEAVPLVVAFLQVLVPQLLRVFEHRRLKVSVAALPACQRLVAVLRQQLQRPDLLHHMQRLRSGEGGAGGVSAVFLAEDYLDALLSAVYRKSQFPADFDFDAAEEAGPDELNEDVETRAEVRKLFVNCCRVRPDRCLQLLAAAMQSQPMPFSTAPFPPLEAALRLVHAFSECGNINLNLNPGGSGARMAKGGGGEHADIVAQFSALIRALQETDVGAHSHGQVALAFFEVSLRYVRYLDAGAVLRLVQSLLGPSGVLSRRSPHVRSRAAYFCLKVVEAPESRAINLLDSVYPQLTAILVETATVELQSQFASHSPLPAASEQSLCEALALMVASANKSDSAAAVHKLQKIVEMQLAQMHRALCLLQEQPQWAEELCAFCAQRISCLAGLSKGLTAKSQPAAMPIFEAAAGAVATVACTLPRHQLLRGKVLIFLHRMAFVLGARVLPYDEQVLRAMLSIPELQAAEAAEAVQVLNQMLAEFGGACLRTVDALLLEVLQKFRAMLAALEASTASVSALVLEAPHVQAERLGLQRQQLFFLQHVVLHGCAATLCCNPAHLPLLQDLLCHTVLQGVSGGAARGGGIDSSGGQSQTQAQPAESISVQMQDTVPLRKHAIGILNALVEAWLLPPAPAAEANSGGAGNYSAGGGEESRPSAEVAAAFREYLQRDALPLAMRTISAWNTAALSLQPLQYLDVNDAAAQGVLTELAVLLRNAAAAIDAAEGTVPGVAGGPSDVEGPGARYFFSMLSAQGWPLESVHSLLQLLCAGTPLGSFKDSFKKFVRHCAAVYRQPR